MVLPEKQRSLISRDLWRTAVEEWIFRFSSHQADLKEQSQTSDYCSSPYKSVQINDVGQEIEVIKMCVCVWTFKKEDQFEI